MMNRFWNVLFVALSSMTSIFLMANGFPSSLEVSLKVEQEIDQLEHPLPIIEPLFDSHLRNVSICKDPEGNYYLTGTTDDNWGVSEGIRVWKSDDLINWKQLGENGFVWTFENDGHAWQKEIAYDGRWKQHYRAIWAPEIHYLKPHNDSSTDCFLRP